MDPWETARKGRRERPWEHVIYRCTGCMQRLRTQAWIHGFEHDGCPSPKPGRWAAPVPFPVEAIRERAQEQLGKAAGHFDRLSAGMQKALREIQRKLIQIPNYTPTEEETGWLTNASDARLYPEPPSKPKRRRRRRRSGSPTRSPAARQSGPKRPKS